MALKRIKEVEKNLNCSITINYSSNTLEQMRNGVITGSQQYDLVTGNSYWMVSDIRAGYYQGLSTLLDIKSDNRVEDGYHYVILEWYITLRLNIFALGNPTMTILDNVTPLVFVGVSPYAVTDLTDITLVVPGLFTA